MKIAFHFNADEAALGLCYGEVIRTTFFRAVLSDRDKAIRTLILQDDLLLAGNTMDRIPLTERCDVSYFNEQFQADIQSLIDITNGWGTQLKAIKERLQSGSVYAICLETVSLQSARKIDKQLRTFPWYLGAIKVDNTRYVHRAMYINAMTPYYRLMGRKLHILWDILEYGSSPNFDDVEQFKRIGFDAVIFEPFNNEQYMFGLTH